MATTQAWRELPTKGDKPKKLLEYFKVLKSYPRLSAHLLHDMGRTVGDIELGTLLMKQHLKMLTNIVKRLSDLMKKCLFTRHDSALFRHRWRLCSGNGPGIHLKGNFMLFKRWCLL
jgi:hypothetical protein